MSDVTVKRPEELDSYEGRGNFSYAGAGLGVRAFGMNLLRFPPEWDGYPEHDHAEDGQEEVYVVLEGSATLSAGDESWTLERGALARVGPEVRRRIRPGPDGVTLLALGGAPGRAYEYPAWMPKPV